MSAQGVFTLMKRVTFVDGQEVSVASPGFVACGAYTDYPMEVTGASVSEKFDKIAEIWYRVKDAKFIAGKTILTDGGISTDIDIAPTTIPTTKSAHAVTGETDPSLAFSYQRGYTTVDDSVDANAVPYLGVAYAGDLFDAKDISDNERGVLLPGLDTPSASRPQWNFDRFQTSSASTTAFSFFADSSEIAFSASYSAVSDFFVSPVDGEGYETHNVKIEFSNKIAVVKVNPTDPLFAPTNKFFIGVRFESLYIIGSIVSYYSAFPASGAVANYVIRLSNGEDLSCPLGLLSALDDTVTFSGVDYVHKATEWMPYATDQNPFGRVWESETGIKIPDGAGHADAGDPDETLAIYSFF